MGTAVIVSGIIMGGLLLLVWLILRSDRTDAKLGVRRADLTKAQKEAKTLKASFRRIEDLTLELQALDSALGNGVLKIIRDTREELENQ